MRTVRNEEEGQGEHQAQGFKSYTVEEKKTKERQAESDYWFAKI